MKQNIITIGGATQDIFLQQNTSAALQFHQDQSNKNFLLLEEGSKIDLEGLHYASGGGATNSAVSLKRQGFENVSSFFKIGDDCQGKFIINCLAKENIDIATHVTTDSVPSGTSFILPTPSGDRIVLAYRGANADIQEGDLPFAVIEKHAYLYITPLAGKSAELLPGLVRRAKKSATTIAVNPGSSQLNSNTESLIAALPFIDILILNAKEAQSLFRWFLKNYPTSNPTNATFKQALESTPNLLNSFYATTAHNFTLTDYVDFIISQGPRIVVVTNGKEGVYVGTNTSLYFHPSIKLPIINSVGAGDAFGSTFFAGLLHDQSIEESILRGIINSASVIQHQDAKAGLLSSAEIDKRTKQLGNQQLQIFSR